MTRRLVCFVVLLSVIGVANAFAQSSMGTVVGTVTDSSGAVIPGASVTLTSLDTAIAATRVSGDRGHFTFINVRPGSYEITVELTGFSTAKVPSFAVGVNETVARNVSLQVGAASETITVTAQSELLQTSSVGLGHVIEQKVIRELPMQGGNFTPLLLLSPGVNPISTAQGPGSKRRLGTGARHRRQLGDAGIDVRQRVDPWASRTARRSITSTASSTPACAPAPTWRCPISIRCRSSRSNRRATRRSTAASPAAW